MISTLAITTRATTSGTETPRIAGTVVPLTTAIAMTTGGNPTADRATAMTRMPERSAAVQETTGKRLTSTDAITMMMHAGRSGTATVVSAIGSHGHVLAARPPAARIGARDRSRPGPRVHITRV